MSPKYNPRTSSLRLSTIAFAPVPPEGCGYIFRTNAPRTALRTVQRSPYAALLQAVFIPDPEPGDANAPALAGGREGAEAGPETGTVYVYPTASPEFTPEQVPAWYRPDPDLLPTLFPVPIPYPPEPEPGEPAPPPPVTNGRYLRAEAAAPTGRWLRLPVPTSSVHYYRKRYADAEFTNRNGTVYARFPGNADPTLPPETYQDPPSDARRSKRERVPGPSKVHVYLLPHCPARHIPAHLRARTRFDLFTPSARYISAEPADLTGPLAAFFQFYASEIICHELTPDPLPNPAPGRYIPLKVYRQTPFRADA